MIANILKVTITPYEGSRQKEVPEPKGDDMSFDFGLSESASFIIRLMLSLSFFVGIMLIVSEEAFYHFNKALQREYGMRKRLISNLEDSSNNFLDWLVLKYRMLSGVLIAVAGFILLLMYN